MLGRRKDTDAPPGCDRPADEPDYTADPDGRIISLDAHLRRAGRGWTVAVIRWQGHRRLRTTRGRHRCLLSPL
ncbi:hypothetical protein BN6_54980 [Saccharothrix espanaensis DSM 44229]|uniref:Uncharacterized protein n=1 Tax=Saccharothrix espanaensis (strain ATCC 51144 / DSM 44229 / JCM 9112 / NBRC 15066 / NRRL 15764) TaxID=1179773 RepID=K0K589_SACES|nr:hypothetical protein BN6_54980 [Saccharothrix espanaensis DSM 44229]